MDSIVDSLLLPPLPPLVSSSSSSSSSLTLAPPPLVLPSSLPSSLTLALPLALYRHPRYVSADTSPPPPSSLAQSPPPSAQTPSYTWTVGSEMSNLQTAAPNNVNVSSSRFCLYCAADTHTVATCFLRRNSARCDHNGPGANGLGANGPGANGPGANASSPS